MCRIAGLTSLFFPLPDMQQAVASMCDAQKHGGPDDRGLYSNAEYHLVLGHRRLSLLDLSPAGHQPMQDPGERYTITYNGEIYNYRELKTELQAIGHRFRTGTDTEVILAAFDAWGTTAFARFNGMFAFALFDGQTGELYLVRDAVGIKPLYYHLQDGSLAFASEVRAFHHLPGGVEEDPTWPVLLMAYGHLPEPVTTLKNVMPLQKGTFLQYNTLSGKHRFSRFDYLVYLEKESGRENIKQKIATALRSAVSRHLVSDAPIGVFLSGGIDSSITALLAGEAEDLRLETLSLYFEERAYSEKEFQQAVRDRLRSHHRAHCLGEAEFHFHLPEIIAAMDLPSSDGINTWFISKLAAESGLKAVLSGLGGDELFGGYPSFSRIHAARLAQMAPAAMLRAGRYSGTKRFRRLAYLSLDGIRGIYLFLRGQFIPPSIAAYLGATEEEVWRLLEEVPALPDIHHLSAGNQASWMEFNLYMQNQLLRDADVMSMAHGVEIRVPFLDRDFVRLALSITSAEKYRGPYGKQLLIDSFSDILPDAVWKRKKMGFSFPFAEWLREDEWVSTKMRSGGKASINMMNRFCEGSVHWSGLLTTLLLRTHQHETEPAFFNA